MAIPRVRCTDRFLKSELYKLENRVYEALLAHDRLMSTIPFNEQLSFRLVYLTDPHDVEIATKRICDAFPGAGLLPEVTTPAKLSEYTYCMHVGIYEKNLGSLLCDLRRSGVKHAFLFARKPIQTSAVKKIQERADKIIDNPYDSELVAPFRPWRFDEERQEIIDDLIVKSAKLICRHTELMHELHAYVLDSLDFYCEHYERPPALAPHWTEIYMADFRKRQQRARDFGQSITDLAPSEDANEVIDSVLRMDPTSRDEDFPETEH